MHEVDNYTNYTYVYTYAMMSECLWFPSGIAPFDQAFLQTDKEILALSERKKCLANLWIFPKGGIDDGKALVELVICQGTALT